MDSNITFLTEEQIFGDAQIDILKKHGTACAITDFSILLGGYVNDDYHTKEGDTGRDRTGWWWTRSDDGDNDARVVGDGGRRLCDYVNIRRGGARPALPYSSISSIASNEVRGSFGIKEVEYGEYPQTIVDERFSRELEENYKRGTGIRKTGKTYTTDSVNYDDYDTSFEPRKHEEFEYKGRKYIRIVGDYNGEDYKLSDGRKIVSGEPYWVAVEPIKWLIDERANIALSKKIIFSGVQFQRTRDYKGDFSRTDIKQFIDKHFSKDIKATATMSYSTSEVKEEFKVEERKSRLQKLNPDTTNPQDRRRMTDTEIIYAWIEAGQSVLLRGPSGIGKTERIKTLYPNLIYIKLTNNMFPEKVVGSMNLQTGQNIPPDFAKQALLACATDEERKLIRENVQNLYDLADEIYERSKNSDEKIVIMLDELLNVKPAVQSLVYTLVLNRLVETGKGLKLPANTVIVATGNQKKYSSVAEDLAEPLEKRFDHILDMQPKVGEWINEYAIPNKIHPSVIGYILSKYIQSGRSESISDMGYFYEEPEVGEKRLDQNGCKGRTNDPRGWVSISNTLYAFEEDLKKGKFVGKDVEHMLEISISSKLREEWAREFFDFYNIPSLSVDEVVTDTFSQADLPRDINERFACVTSLLLADENQVGKCREFIRNHCDPEYLQLYDICWAGNDERKIMRITELQEMAMINEESAGKRL